MKILPTGLVSLILLVPFAVSAATASPAVSQHDADALRASIQSALMSDPTTDTLPPEELDALVTALAADATAKGIRPEDITYIPRPIADVQVAAAGDANAECDMWCVFANAYGLEGMDPTTPILLLVSAGLLVMIFRRAMRPQHIEHFTGVKPAPAAKSTVAPSAPPAPAVPLPPQSPTKIPDQYV